MGIQFTGLASGLDTQGIVADLMEIENLKVVEVEKEQTRMEWKKDAWTEMNTKLYSFYKEELFSFKSQGTYKAKTVTSSNETAVTVSESSAAPVGSHEIVVSNMAKGSFLAGDELGFDINDPTEALTISSTADQLVDFGTALEITLHVKTEVGEASDVSNELTISSTDTIAEIVANIKDLDADLTINFDEEFNRFFISSTKTGANVQLDFTSADDATAEEITIKEGLLAGMGFDVGETTGTLGESANFSYNGTDLVSDNNEISVNGLSMTIRSDTGTSNIAVTTNTDDIYDSVKSFITMYNELTTEMTTKIYADSASDYDILTAEEKEAMTDDEVEVWEDTIKGSLLRNDDAMTNLVYTMRSSLTLSSGVDTSDMEYNFLSDLGIVTGNYTENGILHIEGDEDESLLGLKDNKLRAAIEDNPEKLMEFFSAIGQNLYEKMADRMKSTSLSSSLTFFNDKYMSTQMDDFDDRIEDLEDKIATVEARYYAQFTAMEQAIQQSNSTGDWLAQQLANM